MDKQKWLSEIINIRDNLEININSRYSSKKIEQLFEERRYILTLIFKLQEDDKDWSYFKGKFDAFCAHLEKNYNLKHLVAKIRKKEHPGDVLSLLKKYLKNTESAIFHFSHIRYELRGCYEMNKLLEFGYEKDYNLMGFLQKNGISREWITENLAKLHGLDHYFSDKKHSLLRRLKTTENWNIDKILHGFENELERKVLEDGKLKQEILKKVSPLIKELKKTPLYAQLRKSQTRKKKVKAAMSTFTILIVASMFFFKPNLYGQETSSLDPVDYTNAVEYLLTHEKIDNQWDLNYRIMHNYLNNRQAPLSSTYELEETLKQINAERDQKIKLYEKLIETDSTNAEYHNQLGDLYRGEVGMDQKSFELHKKAVELDSGNANFHADLADDYLNQNKMDLALKEAKTAYELDPSDMNNYNSLKAVYQTNKDWKNMKELAEKELKIIKDPTYIKTLNNHIIYANERLEEQN